MDSFLHDMSWAVALRHETLTPIFFGFTWLGYTTFFLIALPIGYWAWDKNKMTRVALIVLASALLNALLKDILQDPRPDAAIWLDPEMIADGDQSYGLPSGHTQVGIVMWFWLAYEIRKVWAWVAAAIIAGGISFSRLYLGVHDVEDVLGGALIGAATLFAYRWTYTAHFDWWRKLPSTARLGALAIVVVIVGAIWPGGIGATAGIAGFLLAWYGGAAIDKRHLHYEPGPGWWRPVAISALGIVALFFLFDALMDLQERIAPDSAGLALLNSAVIGLAVVVVFPWVFQLLRLARREGATP